MELVTRARVFTNARRCRFTGYVVSNSISLHDSSLCPSMLPMRSSLFVLPLGMMPSGGWTHLFWSIAYGTGVRSSILFYSFSAPDSGCCYTFVSHVRVHLSWSKVNSIFAFVVFDRQYTEHWVVYRDTNGQVWSWKWWICYINVTSPRRWMKESCPPFNRTTK